MNKPNKSRIAAALIGTATVIFPPVAIAQSPQPNLGIVVETSDNRTGECKFHISSSQLTGRIPARVENDPTIVVVLSSKSADLIMSGYAENNWGYYSDKQSPPGQFS